MSAANVRRDVPYPENELYASEIDLPIARSHCVRSSSNNLRVLPLPVTRLFSILFVLFVVSSFESASSAPPTTFSPFSYFEVNQGTTNELHKYIISRTYEAFDSKYIAFVCTPNRTYLAVKDGQLFGDSYSDTTVSFRFWDRPRHSTWKGNPTHTINAPGIKSEDHAFVVSPRAVKEIFSHLRNSDNFEFKLDPRAPALDIQLEQSTGAILELVRNCALLQ